MKRADLHIHSCYSDSSLPIEEIFQQARTNNIDCLALTDHDTVMGVKEFVDLGKKYNIETIPGIEVSAYQDSKEVHILGYFIDYYDVSLVQYSQKIFKERLDRLFHMGDKLNQLGFYVDKDKLQEIIKNRMPSRLHLALYMKENKYVGSLSEAFANYLSEGKPAYTDRFRLKVKEAIELVLKNKGLPFLAHPHAIPLEWIKEFVDYGLKGIEVVYPNYTEQTVKEFSSIADSLGLLKSGGSDSHGTYKESTYIGKVSVPYEWIDKMKDARA